MKIKVLYDINNFIYAYATYEPEGANIIVGDEGISLGCKEAMIDWDELVDPCLCIYDGERLVVSPERIEAIQLEFLRKKREEDCFSVINRGGLWYDLLTRSEKDDLLEWYQAWLDVTITGAIPNKPEWLK